VLAFTFGSGFESYVINELFFMLGYQGKRLSTRGRIVLLLPFCGSMRVSRSWLAKTRFLTLSWTIDHSLREQR